MAKTMYLLFSHELTPEQKEEAVKRLSITKFMPLPRGLVNFWANIPPEPEEIKSHLMEIFQWVGEIPSGNYILIQGDFGATYIMVQFAFKAGLIPVYATTKRVHREEKQPDHSVNMVKTFKHVRFRRYEK